jgi:hypothetical protein
MPAHSVVDIGVVNVALDERSTLIGIEFHVPPLARGCYMGDVFESLRSAGVLEHA